MERNRKRGLKNFKPKRVILILCEGEENKTEKNYFEHFRNQDANYTIKVISKKGTDPINLVKAAKAYKKEYELTDNDSIYCVFDADNDMKKNELIIKAQNMAYKNKIKLIVSTPCIELWFLLHYKYTTANLNTNELIKILKKYYPTYEKNSDIYLEIINNIKTAIKNAKNLEKFQLDNGNILEMVETNPYTEVYKIIEDFNKN